MKRGVKARDAPALPPCIWKAIFDEVARADVVYRAPLRLVCRDWRAWAAPTLDQRLVGRDRRATVFQNYVHHGRLLLSAAFDGHLELCKIARAWMLSDYDEHGARLGTGAPPWWPIVNEMVEVGVRGDHADVVDLAMEWGAWSYSALREAAEIGNASMCWRILEWGATKGDIEMMLCVGFRGGHEEVCALAVDRGARKFVDMLEWVGRAEDRLARVALARKLLGGRLEDRVASGYVSRTLARCWPDVSAVESPSRASPASPKSP